MKPFEQADYSGKTVEIHRNLNLAKRNKSLYVWSVLYRGKLVGHTTDVTLVNCQFRVSAKGRDRIVAKGVRDVCAKVRGTLTTGLVHVDSDEIVDRWYDFEKVNYNPFTSPDFTINGEVVTQADTVLFRDNGCFV